MRQRPCAVIVDSLTEAEIRHGRERASHALIVASCTKRRFQCRRFGMDRDGSDRSAPVNRAGAHAQQFGGIARDSLTCPMLWARICVRIFAMPFT